MVALSIMVFSYSVYCAKITFCTKHVVLGCKSFSVGVVYVMFMVGQLKLHLH